MYDSHTKLKCLASISFILNHSQKHYTLLVYGFQCQEKKKYDFEKLRTFRGWVPMNFHGTKKLLLMVSHDLWAQNWKNVFHGNWNPRAWVRSTLTEMLFDSVAPLVNITSLGSAPINSATCCKREITITFKKKNVKQKK